MKSAISKTPMLLILLAALVLAACGTAPATPTKVPVQETPAAPAATATSAPVLPTGTQPAVTPTQEQPSPAPASPTATLQPTDTPAATPTPGNCEDKVEFVSDVSVEDNTEFNPADKFTKTWRLRNSGTCTWTTDYAIVFVKGDQMSAPSPIKFIADIAPGQTVDVSADMVAPSSVGTYRSDWQLRNASGKNIGLGKDADKTFYVQIVVTASTSDLNLGDPEWKDTFQSGANWYMLKTDNTSFTVEDGHLVMTAIKTGEAEEWGLSNRPGAADFYLEVTYKTGEACSGLDRYGLLARAPDPNSGYVLSFSCDGRYRLYKWDGKNYNALQEWKASPYIQKGPDQTNRIGFWAKGTTLKLYANGKLLAEFEDDTYDEGRFGLLIGASKTEDLVVYVEEVNFWKLE